MAKSYSHLDMRERALIEAHLSLGVRPAAIASSFGAPVRRLRERCEATAGGPGVHAGRPTVALPTCGYHTPQCACEICGLLMG